ncbi:MAG: hypothetical protein ACOC4Y_00805 [bacterium]
MRKFVYLSHSFVKFGFMVVLSLVVGCSAPYHLRKALEKDPDILNTSADTTYQTKTEYYDTTIYIQRSERLEFRMDTGYAERVRPAKDTVYPSLDLEDSLRLKEGRALNDSIGDFTGVLVVLNVGCNIPKTTAYSQDSSAVAEAEVKDDTLSMKVWGRKDTIVEYRDTVTVEQMVIDTIFTVTKETEATIREKKSISSIIKDIFVIIGILAGIFIFLRITGALRLEK